MPKPRQHPYERELEVSHVWLDYPLTSLGEIAWDDYLLNPRQLRGSDFLMRWAQGVWSEHRMLQAMNENGSYLCVEYGPSGVAPEGDPRAFELYFERLEHAGLGDVKRPDLIIFNRSDSNRVSGIIESLGGAKELPFIPESESPMKELLALAIMGIECENSLWKAAQMPAFGSELRPQKRLGGKLGLAKSAVLPTVIVKDQDLKPLQQWQSTTGVPIHVWHSFYDRAYGLPLSKLEQLIAGGLIEPTVQVFQAPGGATTKKAIYKIYYHYAYELGTTIEEPQLVADSITDKNGHIMPYVRFFGGKMKILQSAIDEVDAENRAKK